jgi:hypothetical protein
MKMSPYEVVMGMKPNQSRMWLPGESETVTDVDLDTYFGIKKERLEEIRKKAILAIEKGQQDFLETQKDKRFPHEFHEGQLVLIKDQTPHKFDQAYYGPFLVIQIVSGSVLKLKNPRTGKIDMIHADYAKPYYQRKVDSDNYTTKDFPKATDDTEKDIQPEVKYFNELDDHEVLLEIADAPVPEDIPPASPKEKESENIKSTAESSRRQILAEPPGARFPRAAKALRKLADSTKETYQRILGGPKPAITTPKTQPRLILDRIPSPAQETPQRVTFDLPAAQTEITATDLPEDPDKFEPIIPRKKRVRKGTEQLTLEAAEVYFKDQERQSTRRPRTEAVDKQVDIEERRAVQRPRLDSFEERRTVRRPRLEEIPKQKQTKKKPSRIPVPVVPKPIIKKPVRKSTRARSPQPSGEQFSWRSKPQTPIRLTFEEPNSDDENKETDFVDASDTFNESDLEPNPAQGRFVRRRISTEQE